MDSHLIAQKAALQVLAIALCAVVVGTGLGVVLAWIFP